MKEKIPAVKKGVPSDPLIHLRQCFPKAPTLLDAPGAFFIFVEI